MRHLLTFLLCLFSLSIYGQGVAVRALNGQATNLNVRGLSVTNLTPSRPLYINANATVTNATGTPDGTKFLRDDGALVSPLASLVESNVVWVRKDGNDSTAVAGNYRLSFLTISNGSRALKSGQQLIVGGGIYTEPPVRYNGTNLNQPMLLTNLTDCRITFLGGACMTNGGVDQGSYVLMSNCVNITFENLYIEGKKESTVPTTNGYGLVEFVGTNMNIKFIGGKLRNSSAQGLNSFYSIGPNRNLEVRGVTFENIGETNAIVGVGIADGTAVGVHFNEDIKIIGNTFSNCVRCWELDNQDFYFRNGIFANNTIKNHREVGIMLVGYDSHPNVIKSNIVIVGNNVEHSTAESSILTHAFVFLSSAQAVLIADNIIQSAVYGLVAVSGSPSFSAPSQHSVRNVRFANNVVTRAKGPGVGIYDFVGSAGEVSDIIIENNSFATDDASGGGVQLGGGRDIVIRGNRFWTWPNFDAAIGIYSTVEIADYGANTNIVIEGNYFKTDLAAPNSAQDIYVAASTKGLRVGNNHHVVSGTLGQLVNAGASFSNLTSYSPHSMFGTLSVGTNGVAEIEVFGDDADGILKLNSAHKSSILHVNTNGFVGIGTASPTEALHAEATQNSNLRLFVRNLSSGASATSTLLLGDDSSATGSFLLKGSSGYGAYGGANSLNLINVRNAPTTIGANNAVAMTVLGSGNVGIGTNAPRASLEVSGGAIFGPAGMTNAGVYMGLGRVTSTDLVLTSPDIFFGSGGNVGRLNVPSSGVFLFQNAANTDLARILGGGTTAAYPSLVKTQAHWRVGDGTGNWTTATNGLFFSTGINTTATTTTNINQQAGCVRLAAGQQTYTITNSLATTVSVIVPSVSSDDTTLKSVAVIRGAGFFQLKGNATANADCDLCWFIASP